MLINTKILCAFMSLLTFMSLTLHAAPNNLSQLGLRSKIKKSGFNGVVLVMKDDKVLMKEAFGYKNLESKVPLSTSDKFQIGSLTKQFVAAAILKLEEEGRLSINDSVTKFLPQYEQFDKIKIKDLLNHTSGVINYSDYSVFMNSREPNKIHSLDEIIAFCARHPLDFSPQSKWKYSNGGYIVAGKIIEIASGMSWDRFITDRFLIPLEMFNTGHTNYFEQISDINGHQFTGGKFKVVRGLNLSWVLSAGSLTSTLDDLAKWTQIFDTSRILEDSSKRKMQNTYLQNYALGIFVTKYGNDTLISHGGIVRGFTSKIYYLKKSKLKVITLDNNDGVAKEVPDMLLQFFNGRK